MRKLILVGAGGFIGAVLRYAVAGLTERIFKTTFPIGTITVNVLGCLVIGIVAGMLEVRGALGVGTRLFVMVGILGGFTTFSTFGYETLALTHESQWLRAGVNVGLSVVLGLAAVWVGYTLVRAAVQT